MTTMVSWQMVNPKQPLERVEAPLPEPKDGEVLLKVSGCGVCHTDLGFFYDAVPIKSALPLTLGHEISGIVEATGPGRSMGQMRRRSPGGHALRRMRVLQGRPRQHLQLPEDAGQRHPGWLRQPYRGAGQSSCATSRSTRTCSRSAPPASPWRSCRLWPMPSPRPIRRSSRPACPSRIWPCSSASAVSAASAPAGQELRGRGSGNRPRFAEARKSVSLCRCDLQRQGNPVQGSAQEGLRRRQGERASTTHIKIFETSGHQPPDRRPPSAC